MDSHLRSGRARALAVSSLSLVVLATTVGGCGNGHSDKALSREDYAAAVTRLCAANAREFQRLVETSGGNFLARKGDELVVVTDRNIAKLKSLRPPPELERKAHRLVLKAEATRDRLVVVVRAAKKHPGTVDLGNSGLIELRRRTFRAASAVGATC